MFCMIPIISSTHSPQHTVHTDQTNTPATLCSIDRNSCNTIQISKCPMKFEQVHTATKYELHSTNGIVREATCQISTRPTSHGTQTQHSCTPWQCMPKSRNDIVVGATCVHIISKLWTGHTLPQARTGQHYQTNAMPRAQPNDLVLPRCTTKQKPAPTVVAGASWQQQIRKAMEDARETSLIHQLTIIHSRRHITHKFGLLEKTSGNHCTS